MDENDARRQNSKNLKYMDITKKQKCMLVLEVVTSNSDAT